MSSQGAAPDRPEIPDVRDIADSMLVLYGAHDDEEPGGEEPGEDDSGLYRPYSREPLFPVDPERYEAMRAATERDSEAYLNAGLEPVQCRRCSAVVQVRKLAPGYTAVQWDSTARNCCRYFAEHGDSSRTRSCPDMTASIRHAVAEGMLEENSSAQLPGD